jgi:hypothetical protein
MLRFYIEGDEVEVTDPKFFMDEDEIITMQEAIEDMMENYVNIPMDK